MICLFVCLFKAMQRSGIILCARQEKNGAWVIYVGVCSSAQFKVLLLTCSALTGLGPEYVKDLLLPCKHAQSYPGQPNPTQAAAKMAAAVSCGAKKITGDLLRVREPWFSYPMSSPAA